MSPMLATVQRIWRAERMGTIKKEIRDETLEKAGFQMLVIASAPFPVE